MKLFRLFKNTRVAPCNWHCQFSRPHMTAHSSVQTKLRREIAQKHSSSESAFRSTLRRPHGRFWQTHHNYLILHRKTVHSHGRGEIDIATLHVANVVTREAFRDCRLTGVWLVELWLVLRRLVGVVLLLLNNDATCDYDETQKDADCHGYDEIKIVAFVMFCERNKKSFRDESINWNCSEIPPKLKEKLQTSPSDAHSSFLVEKFFDNISAQY